MYLALARTGRSLHSWHVVSSRGVIGSEVCPGEMALACDLAGISGIDRAPLEGSEQD